jgi:hypothetical protein
MPAIMRRPILDKLDKNMARDNFSKSTKEALAHRAGFRCSFPGCPAHTAGPSDEGEDSISNTGTAAHITAASAGPGARRYDPDISTLERSSIQNGLWCCRTHGTLIDTDEVTYSADMLKKWRALAEKKAQLRQAHGEINFSCHSELIGIGLAPDTIEINSGDHLNAKIGRAVLLSCIAEIWGVRAADAIRDFLIEFCKNSIAHSGAGKINLSIKSDSISIEHNGTYFDWNQLANIESGRGGGLAYRALLNEMKLSAITCRMNPDRSMRLDIPLVRKPSDLPKNNPCAFILNHDNLLNPPNIKDFDGCNKILIVYQGFASYSDIYLCARIVQGFKSGNKAIALILPDVSEGVLEHFKNSLSDVEVMPWR